MSKIKAIILNIKNINKVIFLASTFMYLFIFIYILFFEHRNDIKNTIFHYKEKSLCSIEDISCLTSTNSEVMQGISTILETAALSIPLFSIIYTKNFTLYNVYAAKVFTASFTAFSLKKMIKKTRPDNTNNNSFPSGHATMISVATFTMLSRKKFFSFIFLVTILNFVTYIRIATKKHFISDMIGGIIIGASVVWFYEKIFPKVKNYIKNKYLIKKD